MSHDAVTTWSNPWHTLAIGAACWAVDQAAHAAPSHPAIVAASGGSETVATLWLILTQAAPLVLGFGALWQCWLTYLRLRHDRRVFEHQRAKEAARVAGSVAPVSAGARPIPFFAPGPIRERPGEKFVP